MYETIIFSNGISDVFYSVDLHKINIYCSNYGLDASDYTTFNEVKQTLKL